MRVLKDGQGYELRRAAPVAGAVLAADGTAAPGAELVIYDVIGEDLFGGVSARKVAEDLAALGPVPLDVRLNSPGGDVFEGIAIYNLLNRHAAPVTVHIDALAASIATVVAMAGDRIVISAAALMMVHHASTWTAGDAASLRRMADVLAKADEAIFGTYSARSGRKMASFLSRVAAAGGEWWLTPAEAVKEGLADEVVTEKRGEKMAALLDPGFRLVPPALAAQAPTWVRPSGTATAPEAFEVSAPRRVGVPVAEPVDAADPGLPQQPPQPGAPGPEAAAAAARRRRQAAVADLGS